MLKEHLIGILSVANSVALVHCVVYLNEIICEVRPRQFSVSRQDGIGIGRNRVQGGYKCVRIANPVVVGKINRFLRLK